MIAGARAIRVLVVDDSAFMRRALTKMLESEAGIAVAGVAASGEEAIVSAFKLVPDIITLDVEMPGMGGLAAAQAIVARNGPPIIMISSLTRAGAETTLRALEIGAVDFIAKPESSSFDILHVRRALLEKIRHFGHASVARASLPSPAATHGWDPPARRTVPFACCALGTSTGGPVALATVLGDLPYDFPLPIVIVQHMPPGFTRPLAERLNAASRISVVEGQAGMRLAPGLAIVAPAGKQLSLRRFDAGVEVRLDDDHDKTLHVPSVDIMARAVGVTFGAAALGVILTGMGRDGVAGLTVIKRNGGYIIGQDEASAVVYGMPRAAAAAGLVDRVVALRDIARVMCEVTQTAYHDA